MKIQNKILLAVALIGSVASVNGAEGGAASAQENTEGLQEPQDSLELFNALAGIRSRRIARAGEASASLAGAAVDVAVVGAEEEFVFKPEYLVNDEKLLQVADSPDMPLDLLADIVSGVLVRTFRSKGWTKEELRLVDPLIRSHALMHLKESNESFKFRDDAQERTFWTNLITLADVFEERSK